MQTAFACALRGENQSPTPEAAPLPIYHLSVKTVSRSAGRSATAAAAYRAADKIEDERTGEIHDYTRKGGVESAELVLPTHAPEWASDRAQLWNQAEGAEKRKNATVAREFEIALPCELNANQRKALAHAFAREIVARHGCAADVCIHEPSKEGDERNHHAHILLTTRQLGADGFGAKTRELDDQKTGPLLVTQWRERFAQLQNEHLAQAGCAERVDHRTLKAQGIERLPTAHLGPEASGYERRTGETSRIRSDWESKVLDADKDTWARGVGIGFQQDAIDRAKAELEAALAEKAAREAEEEAQRIERMTAAELTAEIRRMRPEAVEVLVDREPKVQQAQVALDESQLSVRNLEKAAKRLNQQEQDWRSTHPMRAKLHDMGLHTSILKELSERKQQVEAQQAEAGPRLQASQAAWVHERQSAFERISAQQRPVLEQVAELEAVRDRKAREEREAERERLRIQDPERRAHYEAMSESFQRDSIEVALKRFPELINIYGSLTIVEKKLERAQIKLTTEQKQTIRDRAYESAIKTIEAGRIPQHKVVIKKEIRYESERKPKSRDLER